MCLLCWFINQGIKSASVSFPSLLFLWFPWSHCNIRSHQHQAQGQLHPAGQRTVELWAHHHESNIILYRIQQMSTTWWHMCSHVVRQLLHTCIRTVLWWAPDWVLLRLRPSVSVSVNGLQFLWRNDCRRRRTERGQSEQRHMRTRGINHLNTCLILFVYELIKNDALSRVSSSERCVSW